MLLLLQSLERFAHPPQLSPTQTSAAPPTALPAAHALASARVGLAVRAHLLPFVEGMASGLSATPVSEVSAPTLPDMACLQSGPVMADTRFFEEVHRGTMDSRTSGYVTLTQRCATNGMRHVAYAAVCPTSPTVANTTFSCTANSTAGSTCVGECQSGSSSQSPFVATCGGDGQWSVNNSCKRGKLCRSF
jgi:hypothetical protein